MSIVCNYYYTITENGKKILIIGAELRKLLLARYQVQRNMFRFNQQIENIKRYQNQVGEINKSVADCGDDLAVMKRNFDSLRQALIYSRGEIEGQIEQLIRVKQAAADEQASIEALIQESQDTLSVLIQLESANMENLDQLGALLAHEVKAIEDIQAMEREIVQLEAELRFVNSQAEFKPIALAALTAMNENGYELREVISEEGLMTWFEQVETGHQIAVRAEPPTKAVEDSQTWELVAETFNMSGETCLMEIEDFETSMEAVQDTKMEMGSIRIYPKAARSAQREKRGILPSLSQISKSKRYAGRHQIKEQQ